MAEILDDMINDPEGRALVDGTLERKALTAAGFAIETDMSLPAGNVWVMKDGKQVGWIKA